MDNWGIPRGTKKRPNGTILNDLQPLNISGTSREKRNASVVNDRPNVGVINGFPKTRVNGIAKAQIMEGVERMPCTSKLSNNVIYMIIEVKPVV